MKVLSYYDSLLYDADVLLLEDGNWINDKIISFMFEFFQHDKFKEFSNDIAFMDADVVQLLKMCSDSEAKLIIEPLDLSTKRLIFFPINNNNQPLSSGGSHWSLLVFDKNESVVEHYDSCQGFHTDLSEELFLKLSMILSKNPDKISLRQKPVAKQLNGYDCGLYVIKIAEEVCQSKLQARDWSATSLTSGEITNYRIKIKNLISELASKS